MEASSPYNPIKDAKRLPVRIRTADEGDAALIYSSWLKSYASQNRDQPKATVYRLHQKVAKRLLEESITLVACMDDDASQVIGWLCARRTPKFLVVHYCYVKAPFRRFGIARALLSAFDHTPGEPVMVSHKGYIVKEIKDRYNLLYVPHLQHTDGMLEMERLYGTVDDSAKLEL